VSDQQHLVGTDQPASQMRIKVRMPPGNTPFASEKAEKRANSDGL